LAPAPYDRRVFSIDYHAGRATEHFQGDIFKLVAELGRNQRTAR
jgi:hypothetical protein